MKRFAKLIFDIINAHLKQNFKFQHSFEKNIFVLFFTKFVMIFIINLNYLVDKWVDVQVCDDPSKYQRVEVDERTVFVGTQFSKAILFSRLTSRKISV